MSKIIDLNKPVRTPDNETVINNISQWPEPVVLPGIGQCYLLTGGIFRIGATIDLTIPIVPVGYVTITSYWGDPINWKGAGALFRGNSSFPTGFLQLLNCNFVGDITNTLFDITAGGAVGTDWCSFENFKMGVVTGVQKFYNWKITINKAREKLLMDAQLLYWHADDSEETYSLGGDALLHIQGSGTADFTNISGKPQSGDSLYYINPSYTGRVLITDNRNNKSLNGLSFKAGSLDETHPQVTVRGFPGGAKDSQTIGSFYTLRNTTETEISATGDSGAISNFEDAGGGNTRVLTINTPPNGSDVWITDDSYTGKYVTTNTVLNTSFEIVKAYDGGGTGTWDTGWILIAGTTYQGTSERSSMVANNKQQFTNLEEEDGIASAVISVRNTGSVAAAKAREFCIIKNGTDIIKGSVTEIETINKFKETNPNGGTSYIEGDYFGVYTKGVTDTTNPICNIRMTIH